MKKPVPHKPVISRNLLHLVSILLVFVLLLIIIWLWYDLKMTALSKEKSVTALNIYSPHRKPFIL